MTANPDKLVVIGRSQSLTEENRRKLLVMNSSEPNLRVATYDDIYDDAKAVIENFLGPIVDMGPAVNVYFPRNLAQIMGPTDSQTSS